MKLVRHTIYNLLGLGLPLLVAIFSIPVLIKELGEARFGLLTLIWAVVSYFGLFDLGLGRALTQHLAVMLNEKDYKRVGSLVGTAIAVMAALGVIAGALMAATAPWGVSLINDVPNKQEVIYAVYAMALAMPAIVLTSGFRGILEARHAFGVINLIRLPMGLFTFLGPLGMVLWGQSRLDSIAALLAAGRVIACAIHAYYAWRELPNGHGAVRARREFIKPLCVSGGWLTVSNIISPFMGYVDRFAIGSIVSASAVAAYATPHELMIKLGIIPGALTSVLFPAFAAQFGRRDEQTWALYAKSIHWLYAAMLPLTVTIALFSHELLGLWIGEDFAAKSAPLLQIFAVGFFINSLAHVPFTLIQSAGASRLTALAHCAELPIFLAVLWWFTNTFGMLGAALAWLLRMWIDTALMFWLSAPLIGRSIIDFITPRVLLMFLLATLGFAGMLLGPLGLRISWAVGLVLLVSFTLLKKKEALIALRIDSRE